MIATRSTSAQGLQCLHAPPVHHVRRPDHTRLPTPTPACQYRATGPSPSVFQPKNPCAWSIQPHMPACTGRRKTLGHAGGVGPLTINPSSSRFKRQLSKENPALGEPVEGELGAMQSFFLTQNAPQIPMGSTKVRPHPSTHQQNGPAGSTNTHIHRRSRTTAGRHSLLRNL